MKKTRKSLKIGLTLAIVLGILVVFAIPGMVYGYESVLKFELKPGPYAVGFKAVNNYDYTRTYFSDYDRYGEKVSQKARPIQTSIWYPADVKKAEQKERMQYIEYVYLMAQELGYRELTEAVKAKTLAGSHLFFSTPEHRNPGLEVLTNAVREAEPAAGSFPLVVYGPSINSVSFENSVLCEHLAGHGYIVVSSPCFGAVSRYINASSPDAVSLQIDAESQARDILFLLGYMQDFPGVDKSKIALMGFSWGGMSAVLAAMRDTRITALVCIDASVAHNKRVEKIAGNSLYYNIDKLTMPLLYLRSKEFPEKLMEKYGWPPGDNDKFYEDLKYGNAYFIRFNHLMHRDFCSTFLNFLVTKGTDKVESSPEEINRSHNLACKYIQCFLDANLKCDQEAQKYMANSPRENNIADGVIDKRFKKGLKPTPSFGEFANRVKQEGFDKIAWVYGEIKKEFPDYTLVEDRLMDLAAQMFPRGKIEEVLLLLKFTIEVYPNSSDAYYGLGVIHALKGENEAAIKALEKAVELNPRSFTAQKKLKELKEKTGK